MNIEHLENLPVRENRAENLTRRYGNMYSLPKFDDGTSSTKSPWVFNNNLSKRILKKYVNKLFNDANSEYCKKANIADNTTLLEKIKRSTYMQSKVSYFIDNNGFIRTIKNQLSKNVYQVDSWDLEYEWTYLGNGIHEKTLIKGQIFEFNCKDHKYYKTLYEQRALKRKAKRNKLKL